MMKLFPELRRPWSDGLTSSLGLEDYRDPYERYFGLFGSDDGGGGGSDEDVDQDKQQAIAAKNAGLSGDQFDYSGTGISAPEKTGTTFGVNGVSKTGSTAQDAAIGWTSGDNTNTAGPNYGSLKNATAEQMSVVNSVAAQASNQGLDSGQTQAAVKNALDNYETGSVTRSGNLTDKGQTAVQAALSAATTPAPAPEPTAAQKAVDRILSGTDPITQQPAVRNALAQAENQRIASMTSDQLAANNITVAEQRAAQAALTGQTVNPVTGALEGTPTGSILDPFSGELKTTDEMIDDMATRSAAFRAGLSPAERAQLEAIEARNKAAVFGTTVAPEATAEAVLGPSDVARMAIEDAGMVTDMGPYDAQVIGTTSSGLDAGDLMLNPELAGGIGTLPTAAGTVRDLQAQRQLQGPPQFIEETRTPARTVSPTGQALEEVTGFLDYPGTMFDRPASSLVAAGTTMGPQQAADAAAFSAQQQARELSPLEQSIQDAVAASTRSPVEQIGTTPTAPMGAQAAAGTPAEGFYSDAYRELYPGVEGNIPGTGMASFGNTIQELSPIGAIVRGITGAPPLDLPPAEEKAAFQSGQLLGMPGAEIDPTTGAITGAQAGKGTLNMNRFGMVTYSGMPDPNYTGPFANLINPPPEDTGGADEVTAQQVNPCPEGYQLVDGVCQPVDDVTTGEDSQPGSNFVINPTTGLPTLFQPTTQATQVGQINPFVLQPYTPMQAQQIGQARAGIQALSPTGAALGRQV